MFGRIMDWLRSWFTNSNEFTDREKLIFKYFDGQQWLKTDPVVVYRNIMEKWPELKAGLAVAAADIPNKFSANAQKEVSSNLRAIFRIRPLYQDFFVECPNNSGPPTLSDTELIMVFNSFMAWTEQQKKSMRRSPISAREVSPPTEPSLAVVSPIPSSSVSGTTENVNNPESLAPLPQEHSLPLDCSIPESSGTKITAMG